MSTSRYENAPSHKAITFHCDAEHCEEEINTGYSMWGYAREWMRSQGWYILPNLVQEGKWLHLCPLHGKAEWIARKEAEKNT